MIVALLRTALRVVVVVAIVLAATVVALRVTNPGPQRAPGWDELAAMPQARGEVASAVAGGKLYVAGGLRGLGTTSDAVAVYDIASDTWEGSPYTIGRRHHAAATAAKDRVYVSGGATSATDWEPSDSFYELSERRIERLAAMPEGRQGHAMVTVGSRIFVVGGVGPTDDTLIYDIRRRRWSRGAPLPQGRDHLRAAAWGGKVWAIGGRAGDVLDRVDVYDPRSDRWTDGPSLPEPMSAMAVGVAGGRLHVVGGEDPDLIGGKVIGSHHSLAPSATRWRSHRRTLLPVHGAGYGVHDGRLYIAGGASRQGALSTISWTPVTQVFEP